MAFSVHPHAGGENVLDAAKWWATFGSPPRGWGKRYKLEYTTTLQAVHPHAGGENLPIL